MNRLKIKLVAFFLFILVLAFLTLLKLNYVDDLYYASVERWSLNKIPFVVIVSIILTLLILLFFEKRLDFWTGFNFVWILMVIFLFNLYFINYYDYKNVDYFFSKKVENFKVKKGIDDGWINTQIIIERDTLYYNQNSYFRKTYDGDYELFKSTFQKYYYLKKANKK